MNNIDISVIQVYVSRDADINKIQCFTSAGGAKDGGTVGVSLLGFKIVVSTRIVGIW